MSKLLHIQASPRKERSASLAVANHFIEAYCARHPNDTVESLNVWEAALPAFNGAAVDAKYAVIHGQPYTPDQIESWQAVTRLVDHFKSADKYLFSVPMWNFGIPYQLKHYIDVLVQPGLAVAVTPDGPKGLITGRPVVAIHARGFDLGYGSGQQSSDFQAPYLRRILAFIGLTDIHDIILEPTEGDAASHDAVLAAGKRKAAELAAIL